MSNADTQTPFLTAVLELLQNEKRFPYISEKNVRAAVELVRKNSQYDETCTTYLVMDELDRLIRIKGGYAA